MHELTRSDDGEAVMSRSAYDHLVTRGRVNVLRPGKGLGSYALIEYTRYLNGSDCVLKRNTVILKR